MALRLWAILIVTLFSFDVMAEQKSVRHSKDFVAQLGQECTRTDGYVCIDGLEDDFLKLESQRRLIPGVYLAAWAVAYADFQRIEELDEQQKQLRHYKLGFTEDSRHYIVLFNGILLPAIVEGKPEGVINSTFGLSTKYWIDKKTLKVSKRLFLR